MSSVGAAGQDARLGASRTPRLSFARARDQRSRLHDAIVSVVADHGYGGAKIGDIAHRAGVSRATFYELFDDKESCFAEAQDALAQRVGQEIEAGSWCSGDGCGPRGHPRARGDRRARTRDVRVPDPSCPARGPASARLPRPPDVLAPASRRGCVGALGAGGRHARCAGEGPPRRCNPSDVPEPAPPRPLPG